MFEERGFEMERILIIAVKFPEQHEEQFQSTLDELISLGKTAGGTVEKVITQSRRRIHPGTYIGEGKLNEVKNEIDTLNIDLVIVNDELSPGQLRNLNDHLNLRIIDRSQLILDIFAMRAKTKEGKLQVELAQLEYMLPRLQGQGVLMSRLGAGIGTRGPGETKLETDRRHIRRRISDLKQRLNMVVKQRSQYRHRRKTNDVFQIAIVGYTNAGKSTIFNRLTDTESLEENKLFATLDPLTRKLKFPSGFQALLTDTVGFLQKLPTSLIAAFRSTLEEVAEADFLLHLVDGSHMDQEQQQDTVLKLLKELQADTIPMLTVYNKKDSFREPLIPMNHPYIVISAYDEGDLSNMVTEIEEILKTQWRNYMFELPPDQEKIVHRLKQETIVTNHIFDPEKNKFIISGYIRDGHPLNRLFQM